VRNPIIVAEAAAVWGVALSLSSLGALLYATFFTLAAHCIVVYVEEPELRERFDGQYGIVSRGTVGSVLPQDDTDGNDARVVGARGPPA
jgi:protein-S-isoprenylcysteine O-methyltransferase Ste14